MPGAPGAGTGIRSLSVSGRFPWDSQDISLCCQGRGTGQPLPKNGVVLGVSTKLEKGVLSWSRGKKAREESGFGLRGVFF